MFSGETVNSSGLIVVGLILVLHVLDLTTIDERLVADVKTETKYVSLLFINQQLIGNEIYEHILGVFNKRMPNF
jgi:hypothetical protein